MRVIAVNEVGSSLPGPTVSIKAATVPDQPAAPTKAFSDFETIQVQWTNIGLHDGSDAIIGYSVYWDNNSGTIDTANPVGQTNSATLTFEKTGLVSGAEYLFAVAAFNSIGEGP